MLYKVVKLCEFLLLHVFAFHSKSFLFVLTCYWKKTSKVLRNTLCNRSLGTNMGAQSHLIPVSLCDTIYELTLCNYRILGCKFTGPLSVLHSESPLQTEPHVDRNQASSIAQGFFQNGTMAGMCSTLCLHSFSLWLKGRRQSLAPTLFPFQDLM